jgi:hypothetical protein
MSIPQLLDQPNLFQWQYGPPNNKWTLQANAEDYTFFNNNGPDGTLGFYQIKMGKYGNPILIVEPYLAFEAPAGLTYVDSKGEPYVLKEKIGGIICQEESDKTAYRFSLSNPAAPKFEKTEDGISIDGVRWYLKTLFTKDINRIINYDAFYSRVKPAQVKWLELANLNFNAL